MDPSMRKRSFLTCIWYLVSDMWYVVCIMLYVVSGIWQLVSGIWYLASLIFWSGNWFLVPCILYLVSNTLHLVYERILCEHTTRCSYLLKLNVRKNKFNSGVKKQQTFFCRF